MLPQEERGRMMREHGITGRPYLEVLSEYTTGGVGLDDWEWGVTFLVMMISNLRKSFTICALKRRVHDMVSLAISM